LLLGERLVGEMAVDEHMDLGAGDAAAVDLLHLQAGAQVQGSGGVMENLRRNSSVDQRSKEHVARDPGEAVKISNTHKRIFRDLR
jgi:hypothetical protein